MGINPYFLAFLRKLSTDMTKIELAIKQLEKKIAAYKRIGKDASHSIAKLNSIKGEPVKPVVRRGRKKADGT